MAGAGVTAPPDVTQDHTVRLLLYGERRHACEPPDACGRVSQDVGGSTKEEVAARERRRAAVYITVRLRQQHSCGSSGLFQRLVAAMTHGAGAWRSATALAESV